MARRRQVVRYLGTGCVRCGRVKEHPLSLLTPSVGRCAGCGRDLEGDCVAAHTANAFLASDGSYQMYGYGRKRPMTLDEWAGMRRAR